MTVDKRRSARRASLLDWLTNVFCKSQAEESGEVSLWMESVSRRLGYPVNLERTPFFSFFFFLPEYLEPTSPLGDCQMCFSGWRHEDFHRLFNFLYVKVNFPLTNSLCSQSNWWEQWVIKSLLLKMFALFTSWIDFL